MRKLLFVMVFPLHLLAQDYYSFNHSMLDENSKSMYSLTTDTHTAFKPLLFSSTDVESRAIPFQSKYELVNRFFNGHFVSVDREDFKLKLNPLFNFQMGKDDLGNTYTNTRAIELKLQIGDKVSAYSSFYESQAILPKYIEDYLWSVEEGAIDFVLPGQGVARVSAYDRSKRDIDYALANGHVSYQASKHFNFQFGHGKHFIGDGYRSMLLSDNSFNYPYLKITTDVWKLQYVNLFSSYQDLRDEFEMAGVHRKKFSTIHYLSYNLNKRLNIGLFEAIVWEQDTFGRGFDVNYLNPIIFYRPVEFSLGSRGGNAMMGLSMKYKISSLAHVYGQFIIDEFKIDEIRAGNGWWANKYAGQLGFKIYDLFGINNLFLQSEFNASRPYMYSHNRPLQSFTHYGQPLAHPMGASFYESISIARYRYKRAYVELKFLMASKGASVPGSDTNYGFNPSQSYSDNRIEYGNTTAQGNTTDLQMTDLKIGLLLNPQTNMKLELGATNRNVTSLYNVPTHDTHLYLSFKTDLRNFYYDF